MPKVLAVMPDRDKNFFHSLHNSEGQSTRSERTKSMVEEMEKEIYQLETQKTALLQRIALRGEASDEAKSQLVAQRRAFVLQQEDLMRKAAKHGSPKDDNERIDTLITKIQEVEVILYELKEADEARENLPFVNKALQDTYQVYHIFRHDAGLSPKKIERSFALSVKQHSDIKRRRDRGETFASIAESYSIAEEQVFDIVRPGDYNFYVELYKRITEKAVGDALEMLGASHNSCAEISEDIRQRLTAKWAADIAEIAAGRDPTSLRVSPVAPHNPPTTPSNAGSDKAVETAPERKPRKNAATPPTPDEIREAHRLLSWRQRHMNAPVDVEELRKARRAVRWVERERQRQKMQQGPVAAEVYQKS